MRLLLDTNILLWITSETGRLEAQTIALIKDKANTVLFSAASIWEIAIKAGLQRDNFHGVPTDVLAAATQAGFIELPVRSDTALRVAALPHHHRDPFDRLLIAQAMAEPAVLLTTDRILTRYTDLVTLVGRQPS
jgi:PIN domain nuclease of toxin-antitoxin system